MTSATEPTCKQMLKKAFEVTEFDELTVMQAWYEVLDLGYRFGPSTVRNALNQLTEDGYLDKRRKDGRAYVYYSKA